jgi:LacI family transcriptional regulator, repressor for deo operon, udp, cdd, tsx, nupC, and nupG
MQDVADLAGVSVATVSRALRDSSLVAQSTRDRVLAAAEELSFSVSRAASSLATGKLDRIAVLVSGRLSSWFNGSVLDAIYEQLRAARHELLIYRIIDEGQHAEFFATLPAWRNADALIVASFALTTAEHQRLRNLSLPLIYLNQRVRGAASVSIDDLQAARTGTRHLIQLGHRRIGFVATVQRSGLTYSAADRVHGYRAELAAAKIAADPRQIFSARTDADGEAVVAELLSRPSQPTALVVASDELALSVLAALGRAGIDAPGDISVLGFDDHVMSERFGLTTVAQPVTELGRTAAIMALKLAAGSQLRPKSVTLPTRLVLRHTTGRPPKHQIRHSGH